MDMCSGCVCVCVCVHAHTHRCKDEREGGREEVRETARGGVVAERESARERASDREGRGGEDARGRDNERHLSPRRAEGGEKTPLLILPGDVTPIVRRQG